MAWFPNNNHPGDKATYDFHLTAPDAYDAIGNGELVRRKVDNGDDTTTWNWNLDFPMASYLSTSTIGLFDDKRYATPGAKGATGAAAERLQLHRERAAGAPDQAPNKATTTRRCARTRSSSTSRTRSARPYPFDSHGVVARSRAGGGTYALEVQTKSHFG